MSDVVLAYRREGESYVGTIDGTEFSGVSYAAMMAAAAVRLQELPEHGLVIQRLDRPGLLPVALEPQLLAVLREDPVRFIKMNSVAPQTIDLSGKKSKQGQQYVPRSAGLRAGHDALAAAFGERVYVRMRETNSNCRVEHVGTGRWVSLSDFLREFPEMSSAHLAWDLHFILGGEGWLSISTELLLRSSLERFYLPREWNRRGNWVTKAQLQELYDEFKKEKAECLSEMKMAR